MEIDRQLEFVGRLYDVALNPGEWRPVLDEYCALAGAGGASIHVMDTMHDAASITEGGGRHTPEILEAYNRLHAKTDAATLTTIFNDRERRFLHDFEMLGMTDIAEIERHPPIRWLDENVGLFWRVATRLNLSGAWLDVLAFQYPRAAGPMDDALKAQAAPLMPHFAKAVEIGRTFDILKSRYRAVLDALDHLNIGVFVVREDGGIVVRNREAQRIVELRDGLGTSHSGILQVSGSQADVPLLQAINETTATAKGAGMRSEALLSVSRRSGKESFLLAVSPLRDSAGDIERRFGGAIIFVIDPENRQRFSADGMELLYALSKAEADVLARILDGQETGDIAEQRNTSVGTVRQQIKSLMEKTGSHSRADLVRLSVSVNLPIDPPDDD